MDFSLTDEQKLVQQTVRRFVQEELMPLESEVLIARALLKGYVKIGAWE